MKDRRVSRQAAKAQSFVFLCRFASKAGNYLSFT
jgi:hypothetical protein